jgi:cell wall-associated NlpC family hydrolase
MTGNPPYLQFKRCFGGLNSVFAALTLTTAFTIAAIAPRLATATEITSAQSTEAASPIQRIEKNLREMGGKAVDGAAEISSIALSLIGVNYKFGGNTPEQGLDCSGFIRYVFQQATGINLPRSARDQAKVGHSVDKDQLQPGDLVFFNTRRFQFSHVGLYLGNNRFVHSPSSGGSVEVVELDSSYWKKVFNGARRIVGSESVHNAPAAASKSRTSSKNNTTLVLNGSAKANTGATLLAVPVVDINNLPLAITYPMGATPPSTVIFQMTGADR